MPIHGCSVATVPHCVLPKRNLNAAHSYINPSIPSRIVQSVHEYVDKSAEK